MIDFKPSQVVVDMGGATLVGTMGKAECEQAAAVLVRTCHARGNEWRAVTWEEVDATMKQDIADKREPFGGLAGFATNPFFRPDFLALVEGGWARWAAEVVRGPIELTDKALEAMRRYVRGPIILAS